MAQIRPDSLITEYVFSEQEALVAAQLNELQAMRLNTKHALLFKEKASMLIPESPELDRSFFLKIGNIQGKIEMIQELLQDAQIANDQILSNAQQQNTGESKTVEQPPVQTIEIASIADRAATQVNIQN